MPIDKNSSSAQSPQNKEGTRQSCKVFLNLTGKNQDNAKVSFEMSEANADDNLPHCSTVGSSSLVQFEKLEAQNKLDRIQNGLFSNPAFINA